MRFGRVLNNVVEILILVLGVAWGMFSLRQGFPIFFTLSETRLLGDLTVVVFGFFVVFPAAIVAFWRPTISAVSLAAGFFLAGIAFLVDYGLRDTRIFSEHISPNLLLALGYGYLAFSRSR